MKLREVYFAPEKSSIGEIFLNELINQIIKEKQIKHKDPKNKSISIKIKSLLGPINFTWGRGHIIPFDKN